MEVCKSLIPFLLISHFIFQLVSIKNQRKHRHYICRYFRTYSKGVWQWRSKFTI